MAQASGAGWDAALDRLTVQDAAQPRVPAPAFRRLLLACDGSEASGHAVAWAAELTLRQSAQLTVVTVAPRYGTPAAQARGPSELAQALSTVYEEAEEHAQKAMQDARGRLEARGVPHRAIVEHGNPAARVVALAKAEGADLVILGSHGHGGVERINLGSVGSGIKHHAPCSLLVARHAPPTRGILVALDGSAHARAAAEAGIALAQRLEAPLHLGHVVEPRLFGSRGREREAQDLAAAWSAELDRLGLPSRPQVASGAPAQRLREMAQQQGADMIVVGSRGMGGLRSLALGSVSDRLSFEADQSVLVVKPAQP